MEIREYLQILRKWWWLVVLLAVLGTGAAYYFTSQQPPRYSSTATLLLSPALTREALTQEATSRTTPTLAETYARYLKTTAFARYVIEAEALPLSPRDFSKAVSARLVPGTLFFEISAVTEDAALSQRVAQSSADYFIREILRQQQEQQQLRQTAVEVDGTTALLRDKLEAQRDYYEGQIAALREQLDAYGAGPLSAEEREQRDALLGEIITYEGLLVQVMSDQTALVRPAPDPMQFNTVTVVEPASLPGKPLDNGLLQNLLFALSASALLGFALALGLEYLDFTIKSPEALESLYGEAALGVLTTFGRSENVHVLTEPRSAVAEAFRVLRTNLSFSSVEKKLRSLVVTSAGPGEGKTTVAVNLAVVMAQADKRVLLVDIDLRRPTIHKRLELPNTKGFTNLLVSDTPTAPETIEAHLQQGPVDNLQILTSGPLPPNPAELLSLPRTREVLEALIGQVDLVVFDTPPVATVTDAAILASFADGTLQVVQAGQTRRDLVLKARDVLRRVEAKVLGPVLNRVKQRDLGYYYYYYSGYYVAADPAEQGDATGEQRQRRTKHGISSRLRQWLPGASKS